MRAEVRVDDEPLNRLGVDPRELKLAARTSLPVLIIGETGSGKERVARAIHEHSLRSQKPFVPINCGALADQLAAATLFGCVRGAYTGADSNRTGAFEAARGGTLFLDEVGELSLLAQAAILRALELGVVTPVGAVHEQQVDVRVVAATHQRIDLSASRTVFRDDLYYRLSTFVVNVLSLRERRAEIHAIALEILAEARNKHSTTAARFDAESLQLLESYSWPGNIRELRNVVARAAVLTMGDEVHATALPFHIRTPNPPQGAGLHMASESLRERVRAFEIGVVLEAVAACDGNQDQAAKLLGLPRRTLTYKLTKDKRRRAEP